MKSHLDLRCARRLTVAEGRLLLDLLSDVAGAKRLRVKLAAAVDLATHTCNTHGRNGDCSVCGPWGADRVRENRAREFKRRLEVSEREHRERIARSKADALFTPTSLRFEGKVVKGRRL